MVVCVICSKRGTGTTQVNWPSDNESAYSGCGKEGRPPEISLGLTLFKSFKDFSKLYNYFYLYKQKSN